MNAHTAASSGDLDGKSVQYALSCFARQFTHQEMHGYLMLTLFYSLAIMAIAAKSPEKLKQKDNNGWNPLHEAVRGGHLQVVKFLVKQQGMDKVSNMIKWYSDLHW